MIVINIFFSCEREMENEEMEMDMDSLSDITHRELEMYFCMTFLPFCRGSLDPQQVFEGNLTVTLNTNAWC